MWELGGIAYLFHSAHLRALPKVVKLLQEAAEVHRGVTHLPRVQGRLCRTKGEVGRDSMRELLAGKGFTEHVSIAS